MTSIAIVLDAASDIGAEDVKFYNFHLIHHYIKFKSSNYTTAQLSAERLDFLSAQKSETPTTAPPSAREYEALFFNLLSTHDQILCLSISNKISAAHRHARAAAAAFEGRVTVYDTQTISHPLAQQAIRAAQLRDEGRSITEIVAALDTFSQQQFLGCVIGDLKHLEQSGRIKPMQSLVGNLFNLKPIIGLKNGELAPIASYRGESKSIEVLTNKLIEFGVRIGTPMEVTFLYGPGGKEAAQETRLVVRDLGYHDAGMLPISASIAALAGSGTFGVAACPTLKRPSNAPR